MIKLSVWQIYTHADALSHTPWRAHTFGLLHIYSCGVVELSIDSTCWSNWCLWESGEWDVCARRGNSPLLRSRQRGATGGFQSCRRQGGPRGLAGRSDTLPPSLTRHVPGRTGWPPALALLAPAHRRVSRQEEPLALWQSQQPRQAWLIS